MINAFITMRFLDVIDIVLVAFLIYKLYQAIKGTAAFNIFLGIFIFYVSWVVIQGLNMELMGKILGQVMAAGVLALIVVFHPEIRKMFLLLGTRYRLLNVGLSFDNFFSRDQQSMKGEQIKKIVSACESMSKTKTGALIVLTNKAELKEFIETGEEINAEVSAPLIESIFFKNSPLHDGAMVVQGGVIKAARCVLPVTNRKLKNKQLGLRHRAAVGMSQATDAAIIIVSEETGKISFAFDGQLKENVKPIELPQLIDGIHA
ncbi:MAG: diadenylate cyclase CdaA [Prolixibacteraceae bacterium]|nr:diadenylate cyclase CdaA [Prolixibacteraceae bacterium]MBN2650063.1 diadenylate cyclase CdaA [Prolixibacteraceae bacterium]